MKDVKRYHFVVRFEFKPHGAFDLIFKGTKAELDDEIDAERKRFKGQFKKISIIEKKPL